MRRSNRLVPGKTPSFALGAALLIAGIAFMALSSGGVLASPVGLGQEDLAAFIAREFPDRKTAAYDSQRLLSYLSAELQASGWQAELQPYSVTVRVSSPKSLRTTFVNVSGENLLASRTVSSSSDCIDLLLIAPYDLLFKESSSNSHVSYTARSTAILLDFAAGTQAQSENDPDKNVMVAFVSGHYQYGAGAQALLSDLRNKRNLTVKSAIVVGDVDALDCVALTMEEDTPVVLADLIYRRLRESGLDVTVVGARSRAAWYRTAMDTGPGISVTGTVLQQGGFGGEAAILTGLGVPALTLGLPTDNLACSLPAGSPEKTVRIASALREFAGSENTLGDLSHSRTVAGSVVIQLAGRAVFVPQRSLLILGAIVAAMGIMALIASLRSRRGLSTLSPVGGVAAAFGAAHGLRAASFRSAPAAAVRYLFPQRVLFVYLWSGATLVLLGFLRMWSIRTRIAHLHTSAPGAPAAAAVHSKDAGKDWAGPWGLALITAVQLGTTLVGSEIALGAMVAVVAMAAAVLIGLRWPGGRASLLTRRVLCVISALPVSFWAGSPFSKDPARIYAASISTPSLEALSFTVALAASAACFMSTLRFPAPAPPRRARFIILAELAALACLVATGVYVPRSGTGTMPSVAVVRELYGSSGGITLEGSRALGEVILTPGAGEPVIPGVPAVLVGHSAREMVRLPPKAASWATIRCAVQINEKDGKDGKTGHTAGTVLATLSERPSYYSLVFQDVPLSRTTTAPFELRNLPAILGVPAGGSGFNLSVKPASQYSVAVVWWMPAESSVSIPFDVTCTPITSRVDISGSAVYLDKSYAGLNPSSPNTRFLLVTDVTVATGIR